MRIIIILLKVNLFVCLFKHWRDLDFSRIFRLNILVAYNNNEDDCDGDDDDDDGNDHTIEHKAQK